MARPSALTLPMWFPAARRKTPADAARPPAAPAMPDRGQVDTSPHPPPRARRLVCGGRGSRKEGEDETAHSSALPDDAHTGRPANDTLAATVQAGSAVSWTAAAAAAAARASGAPQRRDTRWDARPSCRRISAGRAVARCSRTTGVCALTHPAMMQQWRGPQAQGTNFADRT